MAEIQKINVGAKPDDGTGDTLRDAFIKANSNFEALNVAPQKGDPGPKGDKGAQGEPGKDLSAELAALTARVAALEKPEG
ncbi:hypothetical protein [Morganella morganii]|uniref:hypothetical protein n=1 Tax=Morganella morganii TaxID=582 RepID=UPI00052BD658|nr:hypothetical protein [Morganella morganii]KGP42018.1 hypothetical protein LR61_20410 [Morganella morganii]